MTRNALIPALTPEGSLSRYMEQIRTFPMLKADEEYMLARSLLNAVMWTQPISWSPAICVW